MWLHEPVFNLIFIVVQKLLAVIMSSISLKENGGEVSVKKDYSNGGGVRDLYGEDSATEDHLITPWTFSVARYHYLTFDMSKKTTWNLSVVAFIYLDLCSFICHPINGVSFLAMPD